MQEAAKRCNFNFQSRAEDKALRWVINDNCLEPTLIAGARRDEGGEGGEGDEVEKKNTEEGTGD